MWWVVQLNSRIIDIILHSVYFSIFGVVLHKIFSAHLLSSAVYRLYPPCIVAPHWAGRSKASQLNQLHADIYQGSVDMLQ